ncbi:MAG: SDR family NAD(P)-dependent oxidoreductase [Saprospiraceae bacterium]
MKVIITGATKGIGKATAELFLQNGADIAICSRHPDDLETIKSVWEKSYPNAQILVQKVDMSKRAEVIDFGKQVEKEWGTVDILINNAGVFQYGLLQNEPDDQLSYLLQVNLLGVHYLTRTVLSFLKKPFGQIINICSIASKKPIVNSGSYSVSKYALLGYTDNLREELRKDQIKVTAVVPSATWSDSWKEADLPTERLMATKEVAKAIWQISQFDETTVLEEIVLRPPLGDV